MKRVLLFLLCISLLFCVFTGCTLSKDDMFVREFYSMDTVVIIKVPAASVSSEDEAEAAFNAAETAFEDIAARTSRFCETQEEKNISEVWQINDNAGTKPVAVSDDVFYMIETAVYYGNITDGKFNIAMGALSDLWGFSNNEYRVPSKEEIEETLKLCSISDVVLDSQNKTVYLKTKGMKLDLGAVAKGYATDVMASVLKENGVTSAIINAGGNICALGKKNGSSNWSVGIQNPRESSDIISIVDVSDEYVVSSGDYQRYFEEDGVRYCHIFDSESGYPVFSPIASCVISDDGMLADILSTIAFTLGENDMRSFVNEHKELSDLSWLLIYENDDKSLFITKSDSMGARFEED